MRQTNGEPSSARLVTHQGDRPPRPCGTRWLHAPRGAGRVLPPAGLRLLHEGAAPPRVAEQEDRLLRPVRCQAAAAMTVTLTAEARGVTPTCDWTAGPGEPASVDK